MGSVPHTPASYHVSARSTVTMHNMHSYYERVEELAAKFYPHSRLALVVLLEYAWLMKSLWCVLPTVHTYSY